MVVRSSRMFDKQYERLPLYLQKKVDEVIGRFIEDPFDPRIRNHSLHGSMDRKRAFRVTGSIRVVFEEHGHYTLVVFLDVGGHDHVYE